ncbi:hypothetical protein HUF18_05690 [Thalassolituus sp. ST750PaO-4]|uniref:ATP-grasp fold amidoligase family protein n=1 Tax=Thalassolituus sp. ST750PaO-4 TaxID=2742965 RepID=UPI001CE331E0|nr:ATP-grasp fold amidoligase family protein [Thalassolituus sp. ST750PaO-4]MCA6059262.1 hypothetical protein [Thalassolituus sp. ST750PaO-4]
MTSLEEQILHLEKKGEKTRSLLKIWYKTLKEFKKRHGYFPNLLTPKSFSEKLTYRKLYQRSLLLPLSRFACKYSVRDYIKTSVGEKHLIPLIDTIFDSKDFSLDKLPSSFIMKASHGSGWNYIVHDKKKEDETQLRRLISAWLNCNYSISFTGESQYENIRPCVVVEELLIDENGKVPKDYKFHCFGKAGSEKVIIQVSTDRLQDHSLAFLSEDWDLLDLSFDKYKKTSIKPEKPEDLIQLISIAKDLSKFFDYSRIDLYTHQSNIYFGEITFLPGNGMEKFNPEEMDLEFGLLMKDFELKKDPILKRFIR